MFSLHNRLIKKSFFFTLLWFVGMGIFCFNVSQETGFQGFRTFPLLTHPCQEVLWKLSANISSITLHSHPVGQSWSLWFSTVVRNFTAISGISLVFLLFALVPYVYFQWWALFLLHWLYYEIYMNLLHIGVLDPRNFTTDFSDIKLVVVVFALSYGFSLSLWLTQKISGRFTTLKMPSADEDAPFIPLFFTLLLRFQLPMIVIASILMSF